jgi:hypothetical protein
MHSPEREAFAMTGMPSLNGASDLRPHIARSHAGPCFEVEASMPSEIKAISPLVDRLMRLIKGSRCVAGNEPAVELALDEALDNAVVHGNRMDRQKLFKFFAAVNRERGFPLSSRIRDKDLTRAWCPIPPLPQTSAPSTRGASG